MADTLIVNPTATKLTGLDTKATLDTDSTQGANAALIWTSRLAGVKGNKIKIAQTVPADDNQSHPILVTVSNPGEGQTILITVRLAVSSDGSTITSTGDLIKAAIVAHPEANALVDPQDKAANDGSGLASAFAATSLTGGLKDDVAAKSSYVLDVTGTQIATAIAAGCYCGPAADSYEARREAARRLRYEKIAND